MPLDFDYRASEMRLWRIIMTVYLWVIKFLISITSGVTAVKPYEDAEATVPMGDTNFSLEANQADVRNMYLKNEGTASVDVGIRAEGNTAFGMIMFNPSTLTLAPGQIAPVEISTYALPTATPNDYGFSVIIYKNG